MLEAAQSVLDKHPMIQFQEAQVQIDRGLKAQASSVFDTVLTGGLTQSRTTSPLTHVQQEQDALIGLPGADEITDTTQLSFGAARLFRSGIAVAPGITLTRNVDNLLNPQGVNTADPTVQMTVPLLRGRGRKVVAAQEIAAGSELHASSLDLTNEITTLMTSMADDYWSLVASQRLVGITNEAEERARTDMQNTQVLVDADRLPRENLNEVNAGVAKSVSARIAAEQNLVVSQNQLATDIGMSPVSIASTFLIASDEFPSVARPDGYLPRTPEAIQSYIDGALENRSDYLASQIRIEEQHALTVAAKSHLLPQLNLTAAGGYNGLQEGRRFKDIFDSTANSVDGPNASAGISFSFPPKNELARGAYLQAIETERQLELQKTQLAHVISAAVLSSAQGVQNAAAQAAKAHEAVAFYRASLDGQREKYKLGTASAVDILTVEDLLTTALTTEVQAELAYAQALVQLRSATGTIVPPGQVVHTIPGDVFRTPPSLNELQNQQ